MPSWIIQNGCNIPFGFGQGTVPDVSGALEDWYQPMVFELITKTVEAFQVVETTTPVNFRGVIQPLKPRQIEQKPEGQRAWTYFMLHAQPVLSLNVDDVVIWNGKQTRVLARTDCAQYGYVQYELCQDWTGAGPTVVTP